MQTMSDQNISLPKLAMRLRAVTQRQPYVCKQFLEALSEEKRVAYVEHMEANNYSLLVDPVELDQTVQVLLGHLRQEADQMREQGKFGRGMGSGGRFLAWVKQELLERHGIAWKTPWEMNPDCAFD
jgi:hypothetical protein